MSWLKKVMAAALVAAALLGGVSMAKADYYVYVPKTVYVTKYDHCGNPYTVACTVYVKVLVKTGCNYE